MHFFGAIEGLGGNPSQHIEWAKEKGVSRKLTLFGGSKDSGAVYPQQNYHL